MAIGTSGISVPSMGQSIDPSIYGNKEAPQGVSLSDIVNISRGSVALQKEKALLQPGIEAGEAASRQAIAQANTAELENKQKHLAAASQQVQRLLGKKDLNREDIIDNIIEHAKNFNTPPSVVAQAIAKIPEKGTPLDYQAYLASGLAANLSTQSQLEALYPKVGQIDVGGNIVSTSQGNPLLASETPGVPTGPYLQKSLAPQVATSPTGGPMAFGGGGVPQAGNLENRPVQVQVAPVGGGTAATGMQQNAPQTNAPQGGGVTSQSMSQPKGGSAIPYVPGEPYDAFKVRAGDVAKMPRVASEALNINNIDSIPNARYTNEKIQKMLDNPNLNIGPIADAIAKQTGGIGLSADQQEIMKYLEQRMRMESARTNQDQESQKKAFGSFGTQKSALREILYKDNGSLAGQELYQRGILNHAGDINRPNLQSVNQFNNNYAKLAEPRVVHLIGVIGDKSLKDLTKSDKQHLAKEFSGLSDNQIQELMNKRQKLLDLVGK